MSAQGTFGVLPQSSPDELQVFLLQVVVLLGLALLMGRLLARAGLPAVVGELVAGVLLGPSVLGHAAPGLWHRIFPMEAGQVHLLDGVSQLGVLLLVGITGAHLDLAFVRRRGSTALAVSAGGLVIPLAAGIGIGFMLPASLLSPTSPRGVFALFLGVAMCVSAIPVIARTLIDLRMMHRDLSQLALTAGMVDDAVGWLMLSVVSGLAVGRSNESGVWVLVGTLVAFLAVALSIGRWL